MRLQRLAPLIDQDRGLELHVALLQAVDDGFELLQRLLEAHVLDVGMFRSFGHAEPLAPQGGKVQEEPRQSRVINELDLPTPLKTLFDPKRVSWNFTHATPLPECNAARSKSGAAGK